MRPLTADLVRRVHPLLVAGVQDAIIVTDPHDRILLWNPAAERIYGWAAAEVLGKPSVALIPILDPVERTSQPDVAAALRTYGVWTGAVLQPHHDGRPLALQLRSHALRSAHNRLRGVLTIAHDRTARPPAADLVQAAEARYRTLVQHFPNGAVFLFDRDLRYTLAGGTGLAASGLSSAQFAGKTLWDIFPPEVAARDEPILRAALRGEATRAEVPFGERIYLVHTVPVTGTDDVISGGMVMTQDITERKRAEAAHEELLHAAEQARRAAEAAVQARDHFLAIATHELRTPLTGLVGYADLLQRKSRAGRLDDADATRIADLVVQQAHQLNRLVEQLFDVNRIARGYLELERRPVDLGQLVAQVTDAFRVGLGDETAHRLTVTRAAEGLRVDGDAARLEQVVRNLLSNAVKYSPGGGSVQIDVTRQGREVALSVTDAGIGIPQDEVARLFKSFYRARNVGTISGFGVGLHVVHAIVERHGGRLTVESVEGQGSTFRVLLPLVEPRA